MINFCTNELEGYKNKVPNYRYISVIYKAYNPVRKEWIPVEIPSGLPISKFLKRPVILSIGELERFLEEGEPILNMSVPPEMQEVIYHDLGQSFNFEICSFFQKTQFTRILDSVKNKISDWSLGLERKGILGEEYEFSKDEKDIAKTMTIIIHGNVDGSNVVGSMTNSSATVNNNGKLDFESLRLLVEQIKKEMEKAQTADSEKVVVLKEKIEQLEQSIDNRDESSVVETLKAIAAGAISSGIWSIGSSVSAFLGSLM